MARWSRCSLPSLQMWQETWTTRTWFTSLPTERKRTRNKCNIVLPINGQLMDCCFMLHCFCTALTEEDQDISRPQKWTNMLTCPAPFVLHPQLLLTVSRDKLYYFSLSFCTDSKQLFNRKYQLVRSVHVRLIKVYKGQAFLFSF